MHDPNVDRLVEQAQFHVSLAHSHLQSASRLSLLEAASSVGDDEELSQEDRALARDLESAAAAARPGMERGAPR